MAADPAGADAMAGRLALGQVERIAERADQLGQRYDRSGGGVGEKLMAHGRAGINRAGLTICPLARPRIAPPCRAAYLACQRHNEDAR